MDFRVLAPTERDKLRDALRANAETGKALRLSPRDTSFIGDPAADELTTEETISAIRSIPCHYSREVDLALAMLRKSPGYIDDARAGAPVGNSVVGSLMSLLHGVPRQYAEPAVLRALAIIDREEGADE